MKNLVSEERPVDELAAGSECASKEFMAVKMFIASVFSFSLPLSMLRGSSRGKGGQRDVSVSKLLHWLPLDR